MEVEKRKKLIVSLKQKIFGMLKNFSKKIEIHEKTSFHDIVTAGDTAIEMFLKKKIREKFPKDGFVGEEFGLEKGENNFVWYIDPIDGTMNFAHGIPWYGTSIALVDGEEVVFGAIFLMEDHQMYWAVKGKGAYCEKKRLQVSKKKTLKESILMISISTSDKKGLFSALPGIFEELAGFRYSSCTVINAVYVASGLAEAYWAQENVHPHDYLAGALLVKEAGGEVSGSNPKVKKILLKAPIFLSNGLIHDEMVNLINKKMSGK